MVRGRDACWEHCVLVDAARQKVRCNYCHREFSGGVYRMKFHLAQIRNKDIIPCTDVPDNVREIIQSLVRIPKKQKASKRLKVEQAENGHHNNSSSASGGALPIGECSDQNGSVCPSLFPNASPGVQPEPTAYDDLKQKQDDADKKIALFFLYNAIPFGAATSSYYQEMVHSIAECGVDYKAPSSEKLTHNLLKTVKADVDKIYKNLREEWQETGCTILCDFWSDGRTKSSLVVFSVTCPKGTIFLRSIDVSAHAEDSHYLFGLLESVVLEVGIESVVQVLTDSADSFTYAGKLLMDKYPSIFWSPCASQCITKMLEDFSKLGWVNTVLTEATTITKYIHSNECLRHTVERYCGRMELRPKIPRYVDDFLSLRYLVLHEENLKYVISQVEFLPSSACRQSDAQLIKAMLKTEEFWSPAREAVSISEPLMKTMRMVEGDMPGMGYLYEGMERAKISIKAYYNGIAERYLPIWDIIERRWNMHLYSPLHAAAAFLNPSTVYSLTFKVDSRMRNAFQEAMMKLAINDADKTEITKDHPVYINAQGALGTEFAKKGRTLNAPGDWWAAYGYEIPALQRRAIRILSQPCSSRWCRWNWSIFGNLHSKRLDGEELDKLSDLVFVRSNLWLQEIFQNRDRHYKPVIFDEIDVNSEWPSESKIPFPFLGDNSVLDNVQT